MERWKKIKGRRKNMNGKMKKDKREEEKYEWKDEKI